MTCCPAAVTDVGAADFAMVSAGAGVAVTVAADGGEVTVEPRGVIPDAVAVSWTDPASTSA